MLTTATSRRADSWSEPTDQPPGQAAAGGAREDRSGPTRSISRRSTAAGAAQARLTPSSRTEASTPNTVGPDPARCCSTSKGARPACAWRTAAAATKMPMSPVDRAKSRHGSRSTEPAWAPVPTVSPKVEATNNTTIRRRTRGAKRTATRRRLPARPPWTPALAVPRQLPATPRDPSQVAARGSGLRSAPAGSSPEQRGAHPRSTGYLRSPTVARR